MGEDGPLLKMGTPHSVEEEPDIDYLSDPVGEKNLRPIPSVIRKYYDRALILAASRCFFYCRFCFRRNEEWENSFEPEVDQWKEISRWLDKNNDVTEVILSGGDPLTLDNAKLAAIADILQKKAHLKKWRIHTRAPVVQPSRIDKGLVKALCSPLPLRMVLHVNHPAEISPPLVSAVSKLKNAGIELLSQTVLLAGVNNCSGVLTELFAKLRRAGVEPCYLHNLDRAKGNKKFRLPLEKGLAIYRDMLKCASNGAKEGYPPPYVVDLPNGAGKAKADSLIPTARQTCEGRTRVRYRWIRPLNWNAVVKDEIYEWWDVWEK